jgi:hypothetical protein
MLSHTLTYNSPNLLAELMHQWDSHKVEWNEDHLKDLKNICQQGSNSNLQRQVQALAQVVGSILDGQSTNAQNLLIWLCAVSEVSL